MFPVFIDLEPNILSYLRDGTCIEYYKRHFWPEAQIAALFVSKEVMSELCKLPC